MSYGVFVVWNLEKIDHVITGPCWISFKIWYGKWIIWNSDFCKNCIHFYFCRNCITSSCLLIHFFLFYRYVKPSRRINPWSCVGMSFWWLIAVNRKVPVPYHCCSNHCNSFQDSLIANVEYCLMLFLIWYSKMWKCIHATFWTQSTHWPLTDFHEILVNNFQASFSDYTPSFNIFERGYTGFILSICLSVCATLCTESCLFCKLFLRNSKISFNVIFFY